MSLCADISGHSVCFSLLWAKLSVWNPLLAKSLRSLFTVQNGFESSFKELCSVMDAVRLGTRRDAACTVLRVPSSVLSTASTTYLKIN